MSRSPRLDAGDRVVDRRFFDNHPDALTYVRWATVAECDVQQVPLGTALIVMRRSPTDREHLRVWCVPEPGQPLHPTLGAFQQLPQVTQPNDELGDAPTNP